MMFGFIPEWCSASFRSKRSASPESSPLLCFLRVQGPLLVNRPRLGEKSARLPCAVLIPSIDGKRLTLISGSIPADISWWNGDYTSI